MVRLSERSNWREQSIHEALRGLGSGGEAGKRRKRKPKNNARNYSASSAYDSNVTAMQSGPQATAQDQRSRLADAIGRLLGELEATIEAGQVPMQGHILVITTALCARRR